MRAELEAACQRPGGAEGDAVGAHRPLDAENDRLAVPVVDRQPDPVGGAHERRVRFRCEAAIRRHLRAGEQADAGGGPQLAIPADDQALRGVVGDVIDEVTGDVAGAERGLVGDFTRQHRPADVHRASLAVDQVLGRPVVAGGHRRPRREAVGVGRIELQPLRLTTLAEDAAVHVDIAGRLAAVVAPRHRQRGKRSRAEAGFNQGMPPRVERIERGEVRALRVERVETQQPRPWVLVAAFKARSQLQELSGATVDSCVDVVVVDAEERHRGDELHPRLRTRRRGQEENSEARQRSRRCLSSRHGSAEVQ